VIAVLTGWRSSFRLRAVMVLLIALAGALSVSPAAADKIRDLAEIEGARDNQLVGFGVVSGLAGTGDDASAPIAAQATIAMLRRLGVQIDPNQLRLRNVAAVVVTATLPPFARPGTRLDIAVSSIGNARSIAGGVLVQSLLKGPDQKTYAVAQGSLVVGGFSARGKSGSSTKQGSVTTGRIPLGAIVEKEVPTRIVDKGQLVLLLRSPGFTTASRMSAAIDAAIGKGSALARDGGAIVVKVPAGDADIVALLAKIEDLDVSPLRKARIVISERNGAIVAGGDVRLGPAAIVHGNLTVVIKEQPVAVQPLIGTATVLPRTEVEAQEIRTPMLYLGGAATLADVAKAISTLGLSARELASVLSALRPAGALEAEIIVE